LLSAAPVADPGIISRRDYDRQHFLQLRTVARQRIADENAAQIAASAIANESVARRSIRLFAVEYGVSADDILGQSELRSIVIPRSLAISITKKITRCSLAKASLWFGGKSNRAIINACLRIELLIKQDSNFAATAGRLENKIRRVDSE
jgi:chromosomal replication initiator protein